MKKLLILLALFAVSISGFTQNDTDKKEGLKKIGAGSGADNITIFVNGIVGKSMESLGGLKGLPSLGDIDISIPEMDFNFDFDHLDIDIPDIDIDIPDMNFDFDNLDFDDEDINWNFRNYKKDTKKKREGLKKIENKKGE